MLTPFIVVEGFHDATAVRRAVDADMVITNGHAFGADVEARLRTAHGHRGLIVLTDPDPAGEHIRRRVESLVGACSHAHVARDLCTRNGDIGIEHASAAVIRAALDRVHASQSAPRTEFSVRDLTARGLAGEGGAKARRIAIGAHLGIGYGNARQLLRRLNSYGVSREAFEAAVATLD
ncbi:MAG: ribonuclease M5 [Myxococcota bacterium]|jgi:ribonuclease M5